MFIFAYSDSQDSYKGYIRTAYVNGTTSSATISFGARTIIESSDVKSCDLVYDSVNNRSYLAYKNGGRAKLKYVTLSSGTTPNVNLGSSVSVDDNSMGNSCRVEYDSTNNKVLFVWLASNYYYLRAKAGTPGSSSVSFGSAQNISSYSTDIGGSWDLVWHPANGRFFTGYKESSAYHQIDQHTVNSSNVISNGQHRYHGLTTDNVAMCIPPTGTTDDHFLISVGTYNSQYTINYSWRLSDTISNLPGPNYFAGFPKQTYTNGQTATIQTYGSVIEGFSGLKPGWPYYVQPNGGIGGTWAYQGWPTGDGLSWDSTNNQAHPDADNSWNWSPSSATDTSIRFEDVPVAGLAVGTNKIIMVSSFAKGSPTTWGSGNHQH